MAGITYRTCQFDSNFGQIVGQYQTAIRSQHIDFRTNLSNLDSRLSLFNDISELDAALRALLKTFGLSGRNQLRTRLGLSELLETNAAIEAWLLANTGIAIVNGIYVNQDTARGVDITPYRTAYNIIGLNALENVTSNSEYAFFVRHEDVVYSGVSPRALAASLGISVSDFDAILFVWISSVNKGLKPKLLSLGFPSGAIYNMLRSEVYQNITTVMLPRSDFFSKLRSMGWLDADIIALLESSIERILIDNTIHRSSQTADDYPGYFQDTPHPSTQARALRTQLSDLPSPGTLRTQYGTRQYTPAGVLVRRVLDVERSFRTSEFIQGTADRTSSSDQFSQGNLSVFETHMTTQIQSQTTMMDALGGVLTDIGEIIEDVRAFFGIDNTCGSATQSAMDSLGNMDFGDLLDSVSLQISDFGDLWNAGTSSMSMKLGLATSALSAADNLLCNAATLGCLFDEIGTDQGGEGGNFDASGSIGLSLAEAEDVLAAMDSSLARIFSDTIGLAGAIRNSANILSARAESCESYDGTQYVRSMAQTLSEGSVTIT